MRVREPLLWELTADDTPAAPVIPDVLVDELVAVEEAREVEIEAIAQVEEREREEWLGGDDSAIQVDDSQGALFAAEPKWTDYWKGMPEFAQKDLAPWQTVPVHFRNRADRDAFAALVGQKLYDSVEGDLVPTCRDLADGR